MFRSIRHFTTPVIVFFLFCFNSFASVIINGTRVIYPASQKEVTVKLDNVGKSPVLVQSWIDNGDVNAKPENISVPFILTPPINRIEPNKGQTLRLSYTGTPLPANKESVFWLNVLEIPAKDKALKANNILQMAFRSRIKIFFRPEGLIGNANDSVNSLRWTANGSGVTTSNPTPYHVSLVSVTQGSKKIAGQMVSPYSSLNFSDFSGVKPGSQLQITSVNDYGAIIRTSFTVN